MFPNQASIRSGTGIPLFALTAGSLAVLVMAGCSSQAAPNQAAPAPEVSVAQVLSKQISEWDDFTGRVAAIETVELRPRVSGYVERVAYQEGQEVKKGDLLFVIDQRRYKAQLDQAQAHLERARAAARLAQTQDKRAQTLVKSQVISREDFETRRAATAESDAAVRAAAAVVADAQLDLQFTEVRSPIDARAGRAALTEGNIAQTDTTVLTTLVSQDPVFVYFEADEQSFLRYQELIRNGQRAQAENPVRVGLANEQGYPHAGTVDFTDNQVDSATGTIRARAVLRNPDRVFTPGLFARVQLEGNSRVKAMLIDEKAVLTDQDRKYVYVLGSENAATRKDVQLGRIVDGLRVVSSGLVPTDKVIVHGVQKVFFPGMQVTPKQIAMGAPAPDPTNDQKVAMK